MELEGTNRFDKNMVTNLIKFDVFDNLGTLQNS